MATVRSDLERSELIEETIKLVRGEKEAQGLIWYQGWWRSELDYGTSFCVAGSVAHHAGYVPLEDSDVEWKRPRGTVDHHIQDLGQTLLGIEDGESTWLFSHHRTKREVLGALRRLSAGKTITGFAPYERYTSGSSLWTLQSLGAGGRHPAATRP